MRNLQIMLAAIVGSLSLGSAAFADTSAYNKYTTTHTYGGYSETNVDAEVNSFETVVTDSSTTKVEAIADLGDRNFATVNYDGTKFTANATSSNNEPIDPVATIYVSTVNQSSTKTIEESATIDTFSKYNFSATTFEHEVGNKY